MNWFSRLRLPAQAATETLPPEAVLIDVRTLGEYLAGHVQGAVNLPLDQFAQRIAEVVPNKTTPVLLYCLSGARSGAACSHMQQLGYTDVRNGGSAGAVAMQLNRPIDRG